MKNSAQNDFVMASRRHFAAMLWKTFPGPSEKAVAIKAAQALDVSPRQVVNWLRLEHSAALHFYLAVKAMSRD